MAVCFQEVLLSLPGDREESWEVGVMVRGRPGSMVCRRRRRVLRYKDRGEDNIREREWEVEAVLRLRCFLLSWLIEGDFGQNV